MTIPIIDLKSDQIISWNISKAIFSKLQSMSDNDLIELKGQNETITIEKLNGYVYKVN